MKKENFGLFLALIAAVISGFSIPINKIFVTGLDPTAFTALRALIMGLVFLLIGGFQSNFNFRKFKRVSWKYLIVIGIIGGGLAFIIYFTGLGLTTGGRAAFFHKTLPVYAGIFAVLFLKEKVPRKHWYSLLLMIIGALMIYFTQIPPSVLWSNPGLGDALVIGATVLWAIENTIAKKVMKDGESSVIVSFGRMFIGSIFLFGVLALMGKVNVLLTLSAEQLNNIFISSSILFGYVFFWYWSLKNIDLSKATALLLIAPVISLVVGVWWFSEPVPLLQIVGSALILVGAFFVANAKNKTSSDQTMESGI